MPARGRAGASAGLSSSVVGEGLIALVQPFGPEATDGLKIRVLLVLLSGFGFQLNGLSGKNLTMLAAKQSEDVRARRSTSASLPILRRIRVSSKNAAFAAGNARSVDDRCYSKS